MWEVQELLQKGMDALSQAEVASALQVYFNLGELTEVGLELRPDMFSQYLACSDSSALDRRRAVYTAGPRRTYSPHVCRARNSLLNKLIL